MHAGRDAHEEGVVRLRRQMPPRRRHDEGRGRDQPQPRGHRRRRPHPQGTPHGRAALQHVPPHRRGGRPLLPRQDGLRELPAGLQGGAPRAMARGHGDAQAPGGARRTATGRGGAVGLHHTLRVVVDTALVLLERDTPGAADVRRRAPAGTAAMLRQAPACNRATHGHALHREAEHRPPPPPGEMGGHPGHRGPLHRPMQQPKPVRRQRGQDGLREGRGVVLHHVLPGAPPIAQAPSRRDAQPVVLDATPRRAGLRLPTIDHGVLRDGGLRLRRVQVSQSGRKEGRRRLRHRAPDEERPLPPGQDPGPATLPHLPGALRRPRAQRGRRAPELHTPDLLDARRQAQAADERDARGAEHLGR